MKNLVPILGYVSSTRKGFSSVLTLNGMQFEIKEEELTKQFPLDTNKNGAVRMFIDPDAEVLVSLKASDLLAQPRRRATGFTIYKYLDDGGTISKSRDDEGGGIPKDPWEDNPPKDPWEDNPPKNPVEDLSR